MYGQTLQQTGFGPTHGYAPASQVPMGGVEVGAYGAPGNGYSPRVEVGYYDINGYPVIGAQMPMMAQHPGAFAPYHGVPWSAPGITQQRPQMVGGARVTEWQPTLDRVLWLGFKFAGILTGANQAVSSQPQDTFAPRKVVVPGSVAPNFEIADLKIGAISQLSSSDPIPAEAFIPNANLTDVHFDTAKISQSVTFSVNNISNATATYRAAMNGFVVR